MSLGDEGQKQQWAINPVSSLERDDELIVPYNMVSMSGVRRPTLGVTMRSLTFDARAQVMRQEWDGAILADIIGRGGGDKSLVFVNPLHPSQALLDGPTSDSTRIKRPMPWPAVIRSNPKPSFVPIVNAGNYLGMHIVLDDIPQMTVETWIQIDEFWTTEEWPDDLIQDQIMIPGLLRWTYPLGYSGRKRALHGDIITPSLNGITALNGQTISSSAAHVPQRRFPATPTPTWCNQVRYAQQKVRRRHFKLVRRTAEVPFDPQIYPPPMEISGS